jgi:meso-butanediol dehydrogenase/(S,S)-butanediol dehydrogenase/diacetyl reductase
MSRRFEGSAVLVTGAASGIGEATARRFAQEGANVALADINHSGAQAVAANIAETYGVQTSAFGFDASDSAQCQNLIEQVADELGKLDVLVNNAGIMDWAPGDEYLDERWERVLRINLFSVFYLSKHALPHLLKSSGCIVNMSSAASIQGVPGAAAYCAAKAGINGLTRSLAVEYADRGVRVNAVCPGAVDTALNTTTPVPDWVDMAKIGRLSPKTGKSSAPSEIAGAVAYLASADACNITGILLSVDGGQVAG